MSTARKKPTRRPPARPAAAPDPVLPIRIRHSIESVPDFSTLIEPSDYVSYYENEHGEQWVFIRKQGAPSALLYGGDDLIGWEPNEVRERTAQEVSEQLLADGMTAKNLAVMQEMIDPLVPGLILNEGERAWLHNAWSTSGIWDSDREAQMEALGRYLGTKHYAPGLTAHPNSADYRSAMRELVFGIGVECGRRGLSGRDIQPLMAAAMKVVSERGADKS